MYNMEKMEKKVVSKDGMADNISPARGRLVVKLLRWPSQSGGGILMTDNYTMVRAEQYITEVIKIGAGTSSAEVGDLVIVSMYSGHHLHTKNDKLKVIQESDIVAFMKDPKEGARFDPETYTPGIGYVLVKFGEVLENVTAAGVIHGEVKTTSKADVATVSAEIVALGAPGEYQEVFDELSIGDTVVFESYVGLPLASLDITSKITYKVLYAFDVLGVVK